MFSNDVEAFSNYVISLSSLLYFNKDERFIPNYKCELLNNNEFSQNPADYSIRTKVDYLADLMFAPTSVLVNNNINYTYTQNIEKFCKEIIHFPKKVKVPKGEIFNNSESLNTFLNKIKIDRFEELKKIVFDDISSNENLYTKNDETGKILEKYPTLITRYFKYKTKWANGDDKPNGNKDWNKESCKDLVEEYLNLRDEIKKQSDYYNQLIKVQDVPTDTDGYPIVDSLKKIYNIFNYTIHTPLEFEIPILENLVKAISIVELEKKTSIGGEPKKSEQKLLVVFEVEKITCDVYSLDILRKKLMTDESALEKLLVNDCWCVKDNNLYFNNPKINSTEDPFLPSICKKIILTSNVNFVLKNNDSNLLLFSSLSENEKKNYQLFGYPVEISNDESGLKAIVKTTYNSDYFFVGLVVRQLNDIPKPNLEKFYWDDESLI